MDFEEHGFGELHEWYVEKVDPVAGLICFVDMSMPAPSRSEQHVAWYHLDAGAVDDRGNARFAFQYEGQSRGRMAVGAGGVASHDALIGGDQVAGGGVGVALDRIDHDEI